MVAKHTALVAAVLLIVTTQARSQEARFSARSDLVVLDVAVTDRRGAFVGGLSQEAFEVFDEGTRQTIDFFAEQNTPATIGLMIDTSGSMLEGQTRIAAAIAAFAEASHPEDEFLPLAFNERVISVLPPGQRFTRDPFELRDGLSSRLAAIGRTRLHDALAEALDALRHGQHERKVLIVLSDGGDNASRLTVDDVRRRVLSSNVVIYAIAIVDPLAFDQNPQALSGLAKATGGLSFRPKGSGTIDEVFESIGRDIRSRYTLAYAPPESADSRMRRIRVNVTPDGQRRVDVRTRTGYIAGVPASSAEGGVK